MHVLVIEYPGYGLYRSSETSEQLILEDAEIIYDYLTTICGVKHKDIILFGRSIGTGPTSYLASLKPCHSALLMSAYTSIKDIAKSFLGWASFMSWIVAERFPNLEYIKNAKCPCFFMHGVLDTLIPYQHSVILEEACPTVSELHLVSEMDHNSFNLMTDLVLPFKGFITKLNYPSLQQTLIQQ